MKGQIVKSMIECVILLETLPIKIRVISQSDFVFI